MDLKQAQKLTLDKVESDLYTNNVRQSIKQNIRERQNTREAFKDAFEVLLESQESSTKTQKDILEELKKLNNEMRENIQEQREEPIEEEELTETSEDEDSEDSEGESRPHFRLPGLLYRGFKGLVSRVNPSTATTLIRNGLIGTAGIASAIAATKYLGEQLSDRTGNDRFGTSFDVMEPSVNALKDNLYKLSTETALTIYNQARASGDAIPPGLSNIIYKEIIGSAGANAALAAYRLIADRLSFDQISRFINKIKTGLKEKTPSLIIEGEPTRALVKVADIIQQPSVLQTPDLIKPSKNPINLYDQPLKSSDIFTPFSLNQPIISLQTPSKQNSFPQNQPVIPDTFTPFLQTPSKQNHFFDQKNRQTSFTSTTK